MAQNVSISILREQSNWKLVTPRKNFFRQNLIKGIIATIQMLSFGPPYSVTFWILIVKKDNYILI